MQSSRECLSVGVDEEGREMAKLTSSGPGLANPVGAPSESVVDSAETFEDGGLTLVKTGRRFNL